LGRSTHRELPTNEPKSDRLPFQATPGSPSEDAVDGDDVEGNEEGEVAWMGGKSKGERRRRRG